MPGQASWRCPLTELKAESEIVANAADVFIGARSTGPGQRRRQAE